MHFSVNSRNLEVNKLHASSVDSASNKIFQLKLIISSLSNSKLASLYDHTIRLWVDFVTCGNSSTTRVAEWSLTLLSIGITEDFRF